MNDKSVHEKKRRPGCLGALFLWPFRGRWWVKTLKLSLLALILYNVIAFISMWCPPVQGVVVDVDTGKPIQGAIVQKFGEGPALFPTEEPGGIRIDGAKGQAVTGADGRFAFPGGVARLAASGFSWKDFVFPFQWLNTIRVRVWQKDYIGVDSDEQGLWWNESTPRKSGNYCKVKRLRLPFVGFFYRILLKRAVTEKEWVTKVGSVSLEELALQGEMNSSMLRKVMSSDQQRLFDDLTGYLERWPHGKMAGTYLLILMDRLACPDSPSNIEDSLRSGELKRPEIPVILMRNRKILHLASDIGPPQKPYRVVVTFADYEKRIAAIEECTSYLQNLSSRGGEK